MWSNIRDKTEVIFWLLWVGLCIPVAFIHATGIYLNNIFKNRRINNEDEYKF